MHLHCPRLCSLSAVPFCLLFSNPKRPLPCFFSSVTSLTPHAEPYALAPRTASNPFLFNYLIHNFGFPQTLALSVSNRFARITTPEKPESVIRYLKRLGFSDAHVRSSVRVSPQILFTRIDKTLEPKIQFFQQLGLTGSDLGKFLSKNPSLLTRSLNDTLIPCVRILKTVLVNDDQNHDLIRVLRRCRWFPTRLLSNISFLGSCGIVGSQLSMILKRQPRLFAMKEPALRGLVSRVVDLGFSIDSRMLVHAVYTVSCLSEETFTRKFELFRKFGFSEDECMKMFRRTPGLLRTSEEKLEVSIEFFMNVINSKKTVLVHRPTCLMFSMEGRVIPRHRVLTIIKSKKLVKKEPSFFNVLSMPEEEFLEKFISKFIDNAEELLVAYKGDIWESSDD